MRIVSRIKKIEAKLRTSKLKIYWLMWLDCQWQESEGLIRNKGESIEDFKRRVLASTHKSYIWVK